MRLSKTLITFSKANAATFGTKAISLETLDFRIIRSFPSVLMS
jgi:hypothetical protein